MCKPKVTAFCWALKNSRHVKVYLLQRLYVTKIIKRSLMGGAYAFTYVVILLSADNATKAYIQWGKFHSAIHTCSSALYVQNLYESHIMAAFNYHLKKTHWAVKCVKVPLNFSFLPLLQLVSTYCWGLHLGLSFANCCCIALVLATESFWGYWQFLGHNPEVTEIRLQ